MVKAGDGKPSYLAMFLSLILPGAWADLSTQMAERHCAILWGCLGGDFNLPQLITRTRMA